MAIINLGSLSLARVVFSKIGRQFPPVMQLDAIFKDQPRGFLHFVYMKLPAFEG